MRSFALFTVLVFAGAVPALPQEAGKSPSDQTQSRSRKEPGATYGKIKDVKAGEKIVIAIDGAPDKTYSLADAKRTITVAEGLAIGDAVKVLETDNKNAKSVQIVRDARPEAERSNRK
jgi:hypothetical protein